MEFSTEPSHRHGAAPHIKTAILYCNLGTPDAPTTSAVRRYLAQFLSDSRVVEIPRLAWLPILHGIILRTRPKKSAAKYAKIWTEQGSPLLTGTTSQADMLEQLLAHNNIPVKVLPAMRYGNPSIASQLDALKAEGIQRILILPAYPQYSGTSTASVVDAVNAWCSTQRNLPELRFVKHFHDHPSYIEALANSVLAHWKKQGRGQHLLMSFHGVPERTRDLGDPYFCECQKTARLLAEKLAIAPENYSVSYQSRFGKAKWVDPSTEHTLKTLISKGKTHVDVMCPGFVCDCLETLEEINIEARYEFMEAGGESFHYIPCINDDVDWIVALGQIARQHLHGWDMFDISAEEAAAQKEKALALGAKA